MCVFPCGPWACRLVARLDACRLRDAEDLREDLQISSGIHRKEILRTIAQLVGQMGGGKPGAEGGDGVGQAGEVPF